ncbi:Riboflavin kinase [Lachnellula arida]|uniref:Riboflavin kinase n=1 Tax=Lachnellula arida TaxID=1316785 RepID=A0A8T9BL26_9HELO|nr:Riboflavin kinase [Lachnellula arida]
MSPDAAAPRAPRPTIIGPDTGPSPPFPLRMEGEVISGFGRGSKELGIPTANIPVTGVPWIEGAESGVYFGYASLHLPASHPDLSSSSNNWRTFPMVMSIGYNPFYKNTVRSAEVHVLHSFAKDFYGSWMRVSVSGFIRRELDYVDVESLIRDIRVDCEVARRSLERGAWGPGKEGKWLEGEGWSESRSGDKSGVESKV